MSEFESETAGAPDPGSYDGLADAGAPAEETAAPDTGGEWSAPFSNEQEMQAAFAAAEARAWNSALSEAEAYYSPLIQEEPGGDMVAPQPQDEETFNDPEFANYVNGIVEERMQERMQAIEPLVGMWAKQQGEQLAQEALDKIANGDPERGVPGIGEFDKQTALMFARSYSEAGHEVDQAFYYGALQAQQYEQKIRDAQDAKWKAQLENGQGAGAVPAPGAGVVEGGPNDPGSYDEAFNRALAQVRSPA